MFLGQRFLTVLNKTGMASVSLRLFRPYPQHLQLHIPNLIITRLSQKRGAFLELRTTAKRVAVDGGMLLVLTSRRKKKSGQPLWPRATDHTLQDVGASLTAAPFVSPLFQCLLLLGGIQQLRRGKKEW